MRLVVLFFFLSILFSCSSKPTLMTQRTFDSISIGMTTSDLIAISGKPYSIKNIGDRCQEYEYIERVMVGNKLAYENHYLLIVINDQIVEKKIRKEIQKPYDMQMPSSYN